MSFTKSYKVWSCNREIRKSVVASNLFEFKIRGAEKLGYGTTVSNMKVVLECDGTEVEDDSYFQHADKDTLFLLLKADEKWLPPGVQALKAAIRAIPRIVCDALSTLELIDKPPSWKIMDEKGNVTVVLQWDQNDRFKKGDSGEPSSWRVEVVTSQPSETHAQYSSSVKTSSSTAASTSRAKLSLDGLPQRPITRSLPFRTLSTEEDEDDDYDFKLGLSPTHDHDHSQCDFHCAALHRGGVATTGAGAGAHVHRSVATSPIPVQEGMGSIPLYAGISGSSDDIIVTSASTGAIPKKTHAKGHVRFMDTEPTKIPVTSNGNSESDSETTEREDEQLCERYLLLVDQLSIDHSRYLNIKDIGIILDKLSSKIVDIEKLEKEKGQDCQNWVIKATIRGEVLREIGIIYNGHYYGIIEHPGYF